MYLPLAEYLARRFQGRGETLDDLIQVASLGLLKAIDRFDRERGVEFSTFATPTIVGEIKRHFRDKAWMVRIPRRLQELNMEIGKVTDIISQERGRAPTVAELAQHVGATEEEVLEAMQASHGYSAESLDAPQEGEDLDLASRIGSTDPAMDIVEVWSSVSVHIQELPERDRRILALRFLEGKTQTQIAKEIGISQMHVSRLLSRVLEELREKAGKEIW